MKRWITVRISLIFVAIFTPNRETIISGKSARRLRSKARILPPDLLREGNERISEVQKVRDRKLNKLEVERREIMNTFQKSLDDIWKKMEDEAAARQRAFEARDPDRKVAL